ncbi:alpha-1,6-glucosidase [Pseudoxanthomonas kalamensis DSM 18571]|uniref:alpha-1,6-glucosidase domain-containing protein n=1 Tax=Pseudoxanthomonas kalamensis TaxID=289483 RepID=UPI0013909E46|nr:alpha-1,6-glucosidase domain-containing protein [Pseudoxanthomonas kalamensis]KAF1710389.1 alpha-1,6-glucosidase [Pseudoxanthomonas kalamensis DSM 18571]
MSTPAGVRVSILGLAFLLATVSPAARAGLFGPTPDCDAADDQRVLSAVEAVEDAHVDARAYWMTRGLLKWPGTGGAARYRLYYAGAGRIVAANGQRVSGADGFLSLRPRTAPLPDAVAERYRYVGEGVVLEPADADMPRLTKLLTGQLVLVEEDGKGMVRDATGLQTAGVLDDIYAKAGEARELGVSFPAEGGTDFALWAPTARQVSMCLYEAHSMQAIDRFPLYPDRETGIWQGNHALRMDSMYYTYLVDVFVPGMGVVRNRVTDPYSVSLDADSRRSYISDLESPALKPDGWDDTPTPSRVAAQTDMVIYELHVRDFSINDPSVSIGNRGKYLAFTEAGSNGMRHLQALSEAGLTDVHLLPVFDFATVPETGCVTPEVPPAAADSEQQQAAVMAVAGRDCFNWGYDPFHFNAPEGSYASDATDGARRVLEFRQMVQALHRIGLRVGMDVVYNHTSASGQAAHSVLDRIVPGYYQRLDAQGRVERSTCCDNTATEHMMMARLMIDSAVLWARQYRVDSFRFDLMGHQPRAAMEALQRKVNAATGREVNLIGEGWNFGEIADGARFVQASQLSLAGSGIGTFSDRARDALRGGGPADSGQALQAEQGWLNGLGYAPNDSAMTGSPQDLLHAADMVRVGLAGTLRDYTLQAFDGSVKPLSEIDYKGQPAGYAAQPGETVNYVENHDNQTLFDINVWKLPRDTSSEDRVRVQMLGAAINLFSQGVAYFHAGLDTLRSKSLDRNSYDSGDWFNRIDWSYRDNYFGTGLPPRNDNGNDYSLMAPLLADAAIRPSPQDIALARDMFRDLLRIRASSGLFRLREADEIERRLSFPNTGPQQNPRVIAGRLVGTDYPTAGFREVLYLVNVSSQMQALVLPEARGKRYRLHPVQDSAQAADPRPREQARYQARSGRFEVPARTAVVYVIE